MLFSALAFFTNITFLGFKHTDRWWFQFLTDVVLVIYCHCCIFFSSYDYTTYVYWLLNDRDSRCFQGLFFCLFVGLLLYLLLPGTLWKRQGETQPRSSSKEGLIDSPVERVATAQPSFRLHLLEITSASSKVIFSSRNNPQPMTGWMHKHLVHCGSNSAKKIPMASVVSGPHHSLRPPFPHSSSLVFLFQALIPRACLVNNLHVELCQH